MAGSRMRLCSHSIGGFCGGIKGVTTSATPMVRAAALAAVALLLAAQVNGAQVRCDSAADLVDTLVNVTGLMTIYSWRLMMVICRTDSFS